MIIRFGTEMRDGGGKSRDRTKLLCLDGLLSASTSLHVLFRMLGGSTIIGSVLCLSALQGIVATGSAKYHSLPSLKEQAELYNGWRSERIANIPYILQKHGVDAWLV